jgi:hypothetical protein
MTTKEVTADISKTNGSNLLKNYRVWEINKD